MDPKRIALARRWAGYYRAEFGWNCLPSDPAKKKPLVRFADWWEASCPADLLDRMPTTNLQIMTGVRWGLCVLDLDGPSAVAVAASWGLPRTWESFHGNGRGSRHLWFRTPRDAEPRGKAILWTDGEKHSAVELLADRCLVMAPPSIHPKSGRPYEFTRGRSPLDLALATLPGWAWRLPNLAARPTEGAATVAAPSPRPTPIRPTGRASRGRLDWRVVLDSLPDLRVVAGCWGLRFARSSAESNGWVSVHDFNREDSNPSARFNLHTGKFWRPGERPISLFELGVQLGHYRDWRECCEALADHYGVLQAS